MEAVERRNFFVGEFEVEDPCILLDPAGMPGLGDNDDLMLDRPAKQDSLSSKCRVRSG